MTHANRIRTGRRLGTLLGTATLVLLAWLVPAGADAASADLAVDQTDSPDPVAENAELTYSVAVSNLGPETATDAVLTDALSSHVDFVSASSTQGNCAQHGKQVVCRLGDLDFDAVNPAATVTIKIIPRKPGTITNTVTAAVAASDSDPVMANDSDTESTTVIAADGGGGGGGTGVTCARRPATIVGSPAGETLFGTDGRDVIKARGGNDLIRGLGVGDVVCAGGGADTVRGGSGNDRLKGGTGRDRLKGGGGADTLRGGPGHDRCRGGGGPDTERSC